MRGKNLLLSLIVQYIGFVRHDITDDITTVSREHSHM